MSAPTQSPAPGTRVKSSQGRVGFVLSQHGSMVRVQFSSSPAPEFVDVNAIEIYPESDPDWVAPPAFAARLTAYRLRAQLSDLVYGYLSSRTQFRPYQFLPVLRFLQSSTRRLLIADEVGLGKTIEAGLIWLELLARGQADRVLVACPPNLTGKWRRELLARFDIDATVLRKGPELDDAIAEMLEVPDRVQGKLTWIVPLTLLRGYYLPRGTDETRVDILAQSGIAWDLVIVDEAHHGRNTGTQTHAAMEGLSQIAEAQIYLTATPLNLGRPDLFNLLRLLQPVRFDSFAAFEDEIIPAALINEAARNSRNRDFAAVAACLDRLKVGPIGQRLQRTTPFRQATELLSQHDSEPEPRTVVLLERALRELHPLAGVFNRTRKRDLTEQFAARTVARIRVNWTAEERGFYDAVIRVAGLSEQPFAVVMPARQTASCIPAMLERYRTKDWTFEAEEGEEDLPWVGTVKLLKQRAAYRDLGIAARKVGGIDSKYERFEEILGQLFDGQVNQAMIFSFFRRTLSYLERRLQASGYTVESIHGGVSIPDRQRIMDRFRSGKFQILLSSEVGAEGLDFEFCACLVNYDLPWNPMRVEQRIGRLDRFGQLHDKIVIVNFEIPGTIETEVFSRLYDRIGVFEQSIGDLDDILGDQIGEELMRLATDLELSEEERRRKLDELAVNFERQRQDLADLDEHRELLAASDELLGEEIGGLHAGVRFIHPREIQWLVQQFFKEHYPATRWYTRQDDSHTVKLDPRIGRGEGPLAKELGTPALRGLRSAAAAGRSMRWTFEPETAVDDSRPEFLTSRHPLVRAIAESTQPESLPLSTSLILDSPNLPPGQYAVGIFESTAIGVDTRRTMFPVAVNLGTAERVIEVGEATLRLLADPLSLSLSAAGRSRIGGQALEMVRVAAAADRAQIEENAIVENLLLYERRKRGIEATFAPKIESMAATVRRTEGSPIEQANRARLVNLQARYAALQGRLEAAKSPEVSIKEIGVVLVDVT